jgi:polyhydroxyalkanoate synthesis regulator phasin
MENSPQEAGRPDSTGSATYTAKTEGLQRRVNSAAQMLSEKGIRPTVTRIRAALGGGSPNDLAPALKHWKEFFGSTLPLRATDSDALPRIPIQIADLAHELWQRANAAATVELKGGSGARAVAIRTEDIESLRSQVSSLRDQLQRESLGYGELRAQAARYEAMAQNALARVEETETRERKYLRDLGAARQRIAELEATVNELRERPATAPRSLRRPTSAARTPRSPRLVKARTKRSSASAKVLRRNSRINTQGAAPRKRRIRRR